MNGYRVEADTCRSQVTLCCFAITPHKIIQLSLATTESGFLHPIAGGGYSGCDFENMPNRSLTLQNKQSSTILI